MQPENKTGLIENSTRSSYLTLKVEVIGMVSLKLGARLQESRFASDIGEDCIVENMMRRHFGTDDKEIIRNLKPGNDILILCTLRKRK